MSRSPRSRKARRLQMEPLEIRSLLSVTVVEAEPNNGRSTANSFAFEADNLAHLVGTSVDDDDKDYFTFIAPADATLNVDVQSTNGTVPGLEIEDAAGDGILQTDPNDGINTGSVQLTAGGRYFIRMRAKDADPAAYHVAISLTDGGGGGDPGGGGGDPGGGDPDGGTPTEVEELEPNNVKSQATPFTLTSGASVALNGVSENSNDKDFFRFTPSESGMLRAAVTTSNGNMASLEVEDPAGNDILETEPNDGQNAAVGQVVAGTTYTVRMRSTTGSAAAYRAVLSLNVNSGGGDPGGDPGGEPGTEPADLVVEAEPNDSRSQATAFAFGSDGEVQLSGTSTSDDDKDFFRFTASESGILRINVLAPGGNLAALQIEDAAGNKLFETEPNDGVQSGAFHVVAGTSYSLRMRSKNNDAAEYLVELKMTREGDLTADTVIDRRDILEAIKAWLQHGNSGQGADDNYDGRVTLEEIVRIRNLQDGPDAQPDAVLSETESNDSQATANPFLLGLDGSIQLQGSSRHDDDKDYFTFTPDASGVLTVNVASPNGNFASLEIEDSASVDIFETEPNDDVNSGTTQVVAGTKYFLRLRSKTDTAADYEVNLALNGGAGGGGNGGNPGGGSTGCEDPDATDLFAESEPNDEKALANCFSLGSDNVAQLTGTSANHDERDFFTFTPSVSGAIHVSVDSISGPRAQLQIEAGQDALVLETEPNNGVNTASGQVVAGTKYYVRLRGADPYYGIGAPANYLTTITLGDATDPTNPPPVEPPNLVLETEDNDELEHADPFALGSDNLVQLMGVSQAGLEESWDFFTFTAEQSGVLSASVVARSGPMSEMQLLAEDGTKLFETSPRTGDNSASGYVEAGSKYYVRVVGGLGEDCYYCVVSPPSEYLVNLSLAPGDAPSAPMAVADTASISEDAGPVVIPVLANDADADAADTKRVVAVSSAGVAAIVQVPPSGSGVTFYPNRAYEHLKAGESVVETFSYTMEDSFGLQSTATVDVTVNGQNDAPRAVADSITVAKNSGPVTIDVLANDTDVDAGDTQAVIAVDGSETPGWIELILIYGVGVGQWHPGTPAIQGTVSVSPDGLSVTYDPGDAFSGLAAGQTATESFRYTMVDSAGAEQTGVVVVTITGESSAEAPASVVAAAPISPASTRSPRTRAAVAQVSAEAKSRPRRSVDTVRAAGTLTAAARNTARRLSAADVDVVFSRSMVNAE